MTDPLARAVWSSLTSHHTRFATGTPLALRFHKDVSPFAASKDDSPESLKALASLVGPENDSIYLMQADAIVLPDTLVAGTSRPGVMLVKQTSPVLPASEETIEKLSAEDSAQMRALAALTKPGPFLARTHELSQFCGIKQDGKLVAMAGERVRLPGYSEISGVCTHPDYRGRGYAAKLSAFIAEQITARGETPFLHSWADNDGAISLYRKLGFEINRDVNVAVVSRADAP
ncbi:GNAT family N-acetyltransferase [Roseibium algae]|uniref:GNAT family N-acetyltransferase n=1 Tax=Roseibium algae TaxID=3123038 RepID=A0ABU8TKF0_9HYPH